MGVYEYHGALGKMKDERLSGILQKASRMVFSVLVVGDVRKSDVEVITKTFDRHGTAMIHRTR